MRKMTWDPKAFVEAWQSAESAKAAAEALGIDRQEARSRATYLRRQGVPLKKFDTHVSAFRDEELMDLVALAKSRVDLCQHGHELGLCLRCRAEGRAA